MEKWCRAWCVAAVGWKAMATLERGSRGPQLPLLLRPPSPVCCLPVSVFVLHLVIKQSAFSQWLFTVSAGKSPSIFGSMPSSQNVAQRTHWLSRNPWLCSQLKQSALRGSSPAWPSQADCDLKLFHRKASFVDFVAICLYPLDVGVGTAVSYSHPGGVRRVGLTLVSPRGTHSVGMKRWRIYGSNWEWAPGRRLTSLLPRTFRRWLNTRSASSQLKFLTCLLSNCKVALITRMWNCNVHWQMIG